MAEYAYKNLRKQSGNSKAGIAEYALLAPHDWFAADGVKSPVAPFANQGDSLTIKTAHEFLDGKGFLYYKLAPQKNSYSYKSVGDLGFKSFNSELKIFIAGSEIEVHEAVKNLLNTPLIVLIKDSNCAANMFYQLGCDCQFAYLSVDFNTSTTNSGIKGFEGTITYDDGPQFYDVDGGPAIFADEVVTPPACPILTLESTNNSITAKWPNSTVLHYDLKLYSSPTVAAIASGTVGSAAGTAEYTFNTNLTANTQYYVKIFPATAGNVVNNACNMVGIKTKA